MTAPVVASTAKRPPALSVSEYQRPPSVRIKPGHSANKRAIGCVLRSLVRLRMQGARQSHIGRRFVDIRQADRAIVKVSPPWSVTRTVIVCEVTARSREKPHSRP